jgi:hypothetical protein
MAERGARPSPILASSHGSGGTATEAASGSISALIVAAAPRAAAASHSPARKPNAMRR